MGWLAYIHDVLWLLATRCHALRHDLIGYRKDACSLGVARVLITRVGCCDSEQGVELVTDRSRIAKFYLHKLIR